jgi:hypothetical protein
MTNGFKVNYQLEELLKEIEQNPQAEQRLQTATKKALRAYRELKAQSELPPDQRPLRRALMTAAEKAAYIGRHGQEQYLALPY